MNTSHAQSDSKVAKPQGETVAIRGQLPARVWPRGQRSTDGLTGKGRREQPESAVAALDGWTLRERRQGEVSGTLTFKPGVALTLRGSVTPQGAEPERLELRRSNTYADEQPRMESTEHG